MFSEVDDALGHRIPTLADGGVPSAVVLSIPGGQHVAERKRKRWARSVTTDSTHPPPGLFKKKAATIARVLASKRVSPKGPQSGMRMLTYFINRGGRGTQQIATGRIGARQATALETSAANASNFTSVEIDNGIHAPLSERLAVSKASFSSSAMVLDSPNAGEGRRILRRCFHDHVSVRHIGE
jgi:tRNA(adenine34) deaminase